MNEDLYIEAKKIVDKLNPKKVKRYAIQQLHQDLMEVNSNGVFKTAEEVVDAAEREGVLPTQRIQRNRGGSVLMKVVHTFSTGAIEEYCLVPISYREKSIVRIAKAMFGFTGHRGESVSHGNSIDIILRNVEDSLLITFPEYLPAGRELVDITRVRKTYATNMKEAA
jgi:hypothetical protein